VRAVSVALIDILAQYCGEVALSGDQQVVEALAAEGADPAFSNGVRPGGPHRGADDPDVGAGEHRVEVGCETIGITSR
jgi:hypothetical protein